MDEGCSERLNSDGALIGKRRYRGRWCLLSERSTSSAERRADRRRASSIVKMGGVVLFLEEGKRVGLDGLMSESSCRLLGRRGKFGVIRNVFDSE